MALLGAFVSPLAFGQIAPTTAGDLTAFRDALNEAQQAADEAKQRGIALDKQAAAATEAAEKARRDAAALAGEVQEAEAGIAVAEARLQLVREERRRIDRSLAAEREPLAKLAAALQGLTSRPSALAVLQPGSLRETVYVRAVLDSTVPIIRERTSDLRGSLSRSRELAMQASATLDELRESRTALDAKRRELLALSESRRLASRNARSAARREADRAQELAGEARSLDELVDRLDRQGQVRGQLAALEGPRPRPGTGAGIGAVSSAPSNAAPSLAISDAEAPPQGYRLPVRGRVTSGFGEAGQSGLRGSGVSLVPARSAQIIAPAAGRIAFAGPYRGYDRIVIVEHENGWTSLITGLARLDVSVGENVVANSPLGIAADSNPLISLELRRDGTPVNPLPVALAN